MSGGGEISHRVGKKLTTARECRTIPPRRNKSRKWRALVPEEGGDSLSQRKQGRKKRNKHPEGELKESEGRRRGVGEGRKSRERRECVVSGKKEKYRLGKNSGPGGARVWLGLGLGVFTYSTKENNDNNRQL